MKEITKIEEAILALAEYLEDVNHSDYKVKSHIAEILDLEKVGGAPDLKQNPARM